MFNSATASVFCLFVVELNSSCVQWKCQRSDQKEVGELNCFNSADFAFLADIA